jgi:hypothetical protein
MMRPRFGLVIATVLIVAALPGAAGATHSDGTGPSEDFAVGTADVALGPFGTLRLHIDWPPREATAAFTGNWRIIRDNPNGGAVHGDLVCLQAVGNTAVFSGVVTDSPSSLVPPGSGILGRIVDNGEGSSRPDEAIFALTPPPTGPAECPSLLLVPSPVERGNYVVHDGGG